MTTDTYEDTTVLTNGYGDVAFKRDGGWITLGDAATLRRWRSDGYPALKGDTASPGARALRWEEITSTPVWVADDDLAEAARAFSQYVVR